MENVEVITDAELLANYAKNFTQEPAAVIETQAPASTLVKLIAGVELDGKIVTEVEIRELNGADEEAIAKAGTLGKSLSMILRRGVVRVGNEKATDELLDQMVSGDRDHLMLAIRSLTFGSELTAEITCQSCSTRVPISIDLNTDVPTRRFNGEWDWDIQTKLGLVKIALPDGKTQRSLMENTDLTAAELSTILLSGCILMVDGLPVVPSRIALELGIGDREKLLKVIADNAPGPRLLEVVTTCEACGEKISTPLSLASLFRL